MTEKAMQIIRTLSGRNLLSDSMQKVIEHSIIAAFENKELLRELKLYDEEHINNDNQTSN